VVSSMLAVGVSLTVGQVVAPLRNGRVVSLALLANFVLMPLGAILVARLLWLDEPLRVALLLLGTAAGAPFLPKLAGIAKGDLALLTLLILTVNVNNLIGLFGTRGVLASVLFLCWGTGIGWLLGGPVSDIRGVMALGTAQRNIAAALVVGGQNFTDPKVVVMVVVVAIVGLLLLFPLARALAVRGEERGR